MNKKCGQLGELASQRMSGRCGFLKEALWLAILVGFLLMCACDYMLNQNLNWRSLRSCACWDVRRGDQAAAVVKPAPATASFLTVVCL